MFHIGGIGWAYCGLWHGATTILVRDFEPTGVLDILERRGVTNAVLVPTMLQMLTAVPGPPSATTPPCARSPTAPPRSPRRS